MDIIVGKMHSLRMTIDRVTELSSAGAVKVAKNKAIDKLSLIEEKFWKNVEKTLVGLGLLVSFCKSTFLDWISIW